MMPRCRLYEFDHFRLDARRRLLWRDGEAVRLKPKVFETLLVLIENRGRLLEKDDLMELLWPASVVEEGNLNKNICELRQLLGEAARENRYIVTVPGRGYNFVAEVREVDADFAEDEHAISSTLACRHNAQTADPPGHSIAVLPFTQLTGDARDEYLGLGIADALITRLSKLRHIVVRPTSAVAHYVPPAEAAEAGRALRVGSVLEGTVRRAGDRIRVSAQLVSVNDKRTLWAAQFDESFTDVFTVEDRVSTQIAKALALELSDDDRELLRRPHTENREAYRLFWLGRYYFNQLPLQLEESLACFQEAIELDPTFALARVELAMCHCFRGLFAIVPPRECYPHARTAVTKALELDPHLAEAYVALGRIEHEHEWNWAAAERAFLRAIDLSPNLAIAHTYYAFHLLMMARAEALIEIDRAQALDPSSLLNPTIKGLIFLARRHYEDAVLMLRDVLERDPAYYPALWLLGMAYEQEGRLEKAISLYEQAALANPVHMLSHLGYAYAIAGRRDDARKALAALDAEASRRYVSPYSFVFIYAGLGDTERVFDWFEKAYEARDPKLATLKVHPRWDSLRDDPRFMDLLCRVGLASQEVVADCCV